MSGHEHTSDGARRRDAGRADGGRDRRGAGARSLRTLLFAVAFAVGCTGVLVGVVGAMDAAEIEHAKLDLRMIPMATRQRERLERHQGRRQVTVGLTGDSNVVAYPRGRRVDDRLRVALERGAPPGTRIAFHSLAAEGVGPWDNYLLADFITAAPPDHLVVEFNLASLCAPWHRRFLRPELGGWLAGERLFEALRLPLHRIGLTADRLLFYMATARVVGFEPWNAFRREQVRLGNAWTHAVEELDVRLGGGSAARLADARRKLNQRETQVPRHARPLPEFTRFTATASRERYSEVLAGVTSDDPDLQVFGATLEAYRRAGVRVIVYVNPLNVEHLRAIGVRADDGLARSVDAVRRVAQEAGATFLDLHDLLPDAAFRDAPGHLTTDESAIDGPRALARVLAPVVLEGIETPQEPKP